jgi:amino acid transporter
MLKLNGEGKVRTMLLWSTLIAAFFGICMVWFSVAAFRFLFYSNFIGILTFAFCQTYLMDQFLFRNSSGIFNRFRLLLFGTLSTLIAITVGGFFIIVSFLNNPMDPPLKQSNEKHSE